MPEIFFSFGPENLVEFRSNLDDRVFKVKIERADWNELVSTSTPIWKIRVKTPSHHTCSVIAHFVEAVLLCPCHPREVRKMFRVWEENNTIEDAHKL